MENVAIPNSSVEIFLKFNFTVGTYTVYHPVGFFIHLYATQTWKKEQIQKGTLSIFNILHYF